MKYEIGDVLFYKVIKKSDDEAEWAVYEIINMENTDAGDLYTLKLKLSNNEFKKIENILQKELDNLTDVSELISYTDYEQSLILFDKDEDIIAQITAHIL
jgi:hypothetical protein